MKLIPYIVGRCAGCGCEIPWREGLDEGNALASGEYVCDDCRGRCRVCNECCEVVLPSDGEYVDGRFYCNDCVDRKIDDGEFFRCDECGELTSGFRTYVESEDIFVCETCLDDFARCDCCDEWIRRDGLNSVENGRRDVCDCCFGNYVECDECGTFVHEDDACSDGYGGCFCADCYEDREDRDGVFGYHCFTDRHEYEERYAIGEPRPTRRFGRNPVLPTFGVELEADDGSFDGSDFREWIDDGYLVHFEHDGSLSSRGVELITQPCTLKYHQTEMRWDELCGRLLAQGFRSHDTSTCGLHVHIGRDALRPSTIVKMDVFINRARGFFSQISRRREFYGSHYSSDKRAEPSKGRHCCGERYQAVNTTNCHTVEIRIFKGTLKHETVLGTIELCHALIGFLDGLPITRIYETDANVLRFVEYVYRNRREYGRLLPMLKALVREGDAVGMIRTYCSRIEENEKRKEAHECA